MFFPWCQYLLSLPIGFSNSLAVKKSTCNAGDAEEEGSIPASGRCPG